MVKHAKSQIKSRPKIAIPSLAPESKIINKPKTRKGKKILENKQPKNLGLKKLLTNANHYRDCLPIGFPGES